MASIYYKHENYPSICWYISDPMVSFNMRMSVSTSLREWNFTNVRQIAILGWEMIKIRDLFHYPMSDICRKRQTCLTFWKSIREDWSTISIETVDWPSRFWQNFLLNLIYIFFSTLQKLVRRFWRHGGPCYYVVESGSVTQCSQI